MSRTLRSCLFIVVFALCALSVACAPTTLQNENFQVDDADFRIDDTAKIEDTKTHRTVLDIVAQYRVAIVQKDFGTLNRIVSKDYYDNASTTHTTKDDYGRSDLKSIFEMMAKHTESIQYRVVIKQIAIKNKTAHIDYEYRYAYQFKVGDEMSWDAGVEVNRLELRQFKGVWKITAGL